MVEKSTSASTLPPATNRVRWPLMSRGMPLELSSRSTTTWKLPVAAL
jgi:hypothetical protein